MNLIGYWHSEDQVREGGKVNKIAKMLVRTVALEGLQPWLQKHSPKKETTSSVDWKA